MPSFEIDSYGVAAVTEYVNFFEEALEAASIIKPEAAIEPVLEESDLEATLSRLPGTSEITDAQSLSGPRQRNNSKFATIETAARGLLSNLIARVSIDSPDFVRVWNFFDLLQCLSDRGQCDPALLVWLIEELLDSQTIPGCRKIFDYLESRRKRIISKNFNDKKLVILRSCNELLRRLSRAEDTAFSGRVFIFLFQSLPSGDKSSVNLRGEYHTQNVTSYDPVPPKVDEAGDQMDVDSQAQGSKDSNDQAANKNVAMNERKRTPSQKTIDVDELYPVFWSLQESFNQPKKLFEAASLSQFQSGLEATLTAFKASPVQHDAKSSRQADEKRGLKRKMESQDDNNGDDDKDVASSFNPKYLTSRDLFELEIGDLSLRRYVLVQALIIMDFLLSLAPQAKERLSSVQVVNKSVAYLDQVLGEDDIKWATAMKHSITEYLKSATDGQYFLRMVETILSRDKNWVRWKIENCPLIERPAITAQEWAKAMDEAMRNTTSKRIRTNAMQPLSLDFLKEGGDDNEQAMQELKQPERYSVPGLKSFERGIQEADLEIDMPMSDASKRDAVESKASNTWRALRIASRTKLALFDKIESYEDVSILFGEKKPREDELEISANGEEDGTGVGKDVKDGEQQITEPPEPSDDGKEAEAPVQTAEDSAEVTVTVPPEQDGASTAEPMSTDEI
ncbi:THO complex subunit 1 transcription elongation factor-domain-containing protein [Coniella lustricola]|uniref:THO complex subunit 1 transcription elongation factor-domain-containing protein n=1 Tax=Coniella lustricola TaxID=2025994 RepID=A0A2T3AMW7_9PEZI|nr:THO complex subunit 1 transcription elongation factor-domain-containing protein [Coniella lustricola]